MEKEKIIKAFEISYSKTETAKNLGYKFYNGSVSRLINGYIKKYNICIDHFDTHKSLRKYKILEKECPICGDMFEARIGSKREKQTCSYSCSNTYFRTGRNNGSFKELTEYDLNSKISDYGYRRICFENHKKECVVCKENIIVEVHHYDGNKTNNNPENLIPLCPTHHKYWHSKHKDIIEKKVNKYVETYLKE